jgi:glutamate dehydrogenase
MLFQNRIGHSKTIERVVALIPRDASDQQNAQAANFIRQYYSLIDEEDLVERKMPDLCGSALAHLQFIREYKSGSPKLRIYNPQLERDGWESLHTVIEIVNDNMPFLVDSVTMEINRQGLGAYLTVHPVLRTRRSSDGVLVELLAPGLQQAGPVESIMRVEVDRRTDPQRLAELENGILRVLSDVRRAVEDYPAMKSVMIRLAAGMPDTIDEAGAFLTWLANRNFIFLGYRDYDLVEESGEDVLRVVPGSGLGILRETGKTRISMSFATVAPETKRLARVADLLVLTKANSRSTVHRAGYLDYVGIKRFDERGEVVGGRRYLGLYTFNAYRSRLADIPLLRRKLNNVVARSGFDPHGRMGKALVTVLEQHPRDELLQRTEDELLDDARGIVSLGYRYLGPTISALTSGLNFNFKLHQTRVEGKSFCTGLRYQIFRSAASFSSAVDKCLWQLANTNL